MPQSSLSLPTSALDLSPSLPNQASLLLRSQPSHIPTVCSSSPPQPILGTQQPFDSFEARVQQEEISYPLNLERNHAYAEEYDEENPDDVAPCHPDVKCDNCGVEYSQPYGEQHIKHCKNCTQVS